MILSILMVYSLLYCSVEDAYTITNLLGTGTLLSKIDSINAFRLISVQQSDWTLLGIHWGDRHDVNKCLSFGLHPGPLSI